ncbi:DNA primase, partial [Candidatus Magnetomorum sp. HK-1]
KLSPNETEIVKNGSNTERILLKNAPKMQGIDYDTTVSVKESMILMKELIFDNLACPEEEKYYIICFIINSFFVNFFKAKGLLKFSGNAGSGKTTAAELITALIFGEVLITTGTTASDYTEATQSPLIILDNLERDGLNTQKKDFLLFLATGVTRRKRDQNNQTGNVYEKVNSQGIITGIEPFEKDELIQRTIELDFKKDYWGNAFSQTEITEEIKQNRNKILSGIIKMISFDILPDFKEKRKKALLFLQQTHTGHSKERLNELFAVLFIVLKEVSKYIPYAGFNETKHQHILLLEKWIQKQDRRAKNTSKNTNEIVKFLESLLDSYLYHENEFSRDFPEIKVEESKAMYTNETESVIITISTQHLLAFFDYEAKRKGIKNPFRTAQALNARIRNSISILKESSWEYKSKVSRDGRGNYKHHLIKYFENQT